MEQSVDSAPDRAAKPAFMWQDHGRFVDVVAVCTGWLVMWGTQEDGGSRKQIHGHRVYRDLAGVRRRLVAAIVELTANPTHAQTAIARLDRQGLPHHQPGALPQPL